MFPQSKLFISGQSLLEVVLALAIFSLIAAAFVSLTLGSISSVSYGTDFIAADTLADEGVGVKRALRDNAWNTLGDGVESATLDGRFNRLMTISPVNLETKSLKVEVSWPSPVGRTQTVTRQTKLTNWDSRDWIQTDWSGGAGQNSWSDPARYDSDDGKVDVSTTGEVKLKALPISWSLFVVTGNQTWNGIAMTSAADGFVVGRAGLIWRLVSGTWSLSVDTGTETWNDVACLSASNCWAVGNSGALAFFNGASWSESVIPSPANIFSIYALSASDIWASGGASGRFAFGRLWHYNGSAWSLFADTGSQTWNDVFMISATDGFVVGGAGLIWRLVSGAWSLSVDTGAETWNDIFCFSASNCWVVGNSGALAFFNGASWSESIIPSPANIFSIYALSASDIWASGASGRLWHYDGSVWSPYSPLPTTQNLNAVFLLSANAGWSAGGSGNILRLTGGGYETPGLLTSSAFDMSDLSPVQIIGWDEQIPVCVPPTACSVKFQIRAADDSAMTGAIWPIPPFNFTTAAGALIPPSYNGKRYVQYQVQLTGDGASTPVLQEVRINYK